MTFREKLTVRILLLVARLVCADPAIASEIRSLSAHIEVNAPDPAEPAPLRAAPAPRPGPPEA